MYNFLCGGLFQAMWNNFYNSIIRNVTPVVKGGIIITLSVLILVCVRIAFQKGDEKKPIKNWFAFWLAVTMLILLILYIILCSL